MELSKRNLICFITHNFQDIFLETLKKLNNSKEPNIDIIVLFDNKNTYDYKIQEQISSIQIYPINLINTSYDHLGHSLYISYFKKYNNKIKEYDYVWVIENDVYYHGNLLDIIKEHNLYKYDLLVPEYGLRSTQWPWAKKLQGFQNIENIGILGVIMRFSSQLMHLLINNIDKKYTGYFEALLPHLCKEFKLTIHQFLPKYIGILTTDKNNPLLKLVAYDIINKSSYVIEKKLYHPLKL